MAHGIYGLALLEVKRKLANQLLVPFLVDRDKDERVGHLVIGCSVQADLRSLVYLLEVEPLHWNI